mgnify:CR=1 FL=1
MKNISIPKPCSENWNEMTPTDIGAFCQKCALEVYDFTNKSGDEIRDILTLNIGSRVCGRIEPRQLNELNTDFSAWQINNTAEGSIADKETFQRAWLFTLLVVFGLTLFSCEEEEGLAVEKFQEIGQVVLTEKIDKTFTKTIEVETKKGEFHLTDKAKLPVSDPRTVQPEIHERHMLGEMVSYEEPRSVEEIVVVVENPRYMTKGAMISTDHYSKYLIERNMERIDQQAIINIEISGLMYPNPATNESTLKVNMPSGDKAEIELVGLNGQRIRTIYSGKLKKGESEFPIDLTGLETGVYLVIIYSAEKRVTVKFSKI